MRIFAGKGAVVAAIALGAFTSYLAWHYVDQANPGQAVVETTPVVVANASIGVRTIITPELLRVQQMPVDGVHPQAVHSSDLVIGKVARIAMIADEPVLSTKLYLQRGESGLAFMVPAGMRAISVGFSEVVGSGGMVAPGDHVDVIGVFEARRSEASSAEARSSDGKSAQAKATPTPVGLPSPDGQGTQTEDKISLATLVLQDVEVLAVAQQLQGETPPDTRGPSLPTMSSGPTGTAAQTMRAEPTPQPAAKTATVAVNPEDALKLVLAEEKGKIRLALRRAKDTDRPAVPQVPMNALLASAR
jgi:pilus assembly protein CpaB